MPEPAAEALLRALVEVFRERGADRLATPEAVAALGERLGRPVTANRVARALGAYGVRPRQFRSGSVRRQMLWDIRCAGLTAMLFS